MKVTLKRFLEVISSPTKHYVRLRLNNTVKPPVLFSEHPDSFVLQILEHEYIFFIQDGDVIVSSPIHKESRVIVAENISDLIKNDNANRTILQYKNGQGLIALSEIPDIKTREMVAVNTNLVNAMGDLLNIVVGHRLPADLIRAPEKQFKINCFSLNKSKPNAMEYLDKVLENPCIRESFLLDWRDSVIKEHMGVSLLEELGPNNTIKWEPHNPHLKYRVWYHPNHGFTFLGSVTDFVIEQTASTQIEFVLDEKSPFSLSININDTKKTFTGDVMIDVIKVGLPETLIKMFS